MAKKPNAESGSKRSRGSHDDGQLEDHADNGKHKNDELKQLREAIARGELSQAQSLALVDNIDHFKKEQWDCLLTIAVDGDYVEMAQCLLERGAKAVCDGRELGGISPFCRAAERGSLEIVQLLLKHGAFEEKEEQEESGHKGRGDLSSALICAAGFGHLNVVRLLVQHGGGDINAYVEHMLNGTALASACFGEHRDVAEFLLKNGAHVENATMTAKKNGVDSSPLLKAVSCCNPKLVRLLLEHGAHVNAVDSFEWTPLMLSRQCPEIARLLLESGADVDAINDHEETALLLAASFGVSETIRLLLQYGADINKLDDAGLTALFHAVLDGCPKCLDLLIKAGADVNGTDAEEPTPYWESPWHARKKYGSPFLWAARNGDIAAIALFLEYGGINMVNTTPIVRGDTALSRASENEHENVVRLVLEHAAGATVGEMVL